MRLAVSNLAWPVTADGEVAALLVAEGVRGVELAPSKVWPTAPHVPPSDAESYAAWWADRGLEVVAFQAILFGHAEMSIFGEGPSLVATQSHLIAMGNLARRCGARVLVLGAPGNRRRGDRSMPAAITAAANALRPVAAALEASGVSLCIEPNPPRYQCDFVHTAAEAAALAEAVGHPNFGVHLDAAALALSGEITERALAPVMPFVRHFHVSEIDLAPVGEPDTVPHERLGDALRGLGYSGWISVEMRGDDAVSWRAAIPRATALVRRCYGGTGIGTRP